jgi:hypothetical protein
MKKYLRHGVNIASRIESFAVAGGILFQQKFTTDQETKITLKQCHSERLN